MLDSFHAKMVTPKTFMNTAGEYDDSTGWKLNTPPSDSTARCEAPTAIDFATPKKSVSSGVPAQRQFTRARRHTAEYRSWRTGGRH
jgi:hypothetical protein